MGFLGLDKIVRTLRYKSADNRDTTVRTAYSEMYNGPPPLKNEHNESFNVGSDISFITDAFPKFVKSVGSRVPKDKIPWCNRYTDRVAFRAELRKGKDEREDKYIAVLWASHSNDLNKYRLEYKTNDLQFIQNRRKG